MIPRRCGNEKMAMMQEKETKKNRKNGKDGKDKKNATISKVLQCYQHRHMHLKQSMK